MTSEASVQAAVRLEYARRGEMLFRNNVGVLVNPHTGQPVRYGLANESSAENRRTKSGDLIGWRSFIIPQEWVGHRIAQFVSREIKASDWAPALPSDKARYAHEEAQRRWAAIVRADGGVAEFMTGVE